MKQYDDYQVVAQKWVDEIQNTGIFIESSAFSPSVSKKTTPVITENILSLTAKQGVVPLPKKRSWRK